MMKKYLILLILFYGCATPNNNSDTSMHLDVFSKKIQSLDFMSYKVAPLDTHSDILLSNRLLTKFFNEEIYILDLGSQKSVFRFDIYGNYINTIGAVGNGPAEYIEPNDFTQYGDTILILSSMGEYSKISKYQKNGDFVNEEIVNRVMFSFEKTESGYIINTGFPKNNNPYRYYIVDNQFNKEKGLLKNIHDFRIPMSETNFFLNDNVVFIHEAFNNCVYKLENDSFIETYNLDFSDYSIPAEFYSMDPMKGISFLNEKGFANIKNYLENDSYSVFEIILQKQNKPTNIYHIVYSKKTDKLYYHIFSTDLLDQILLKQLVSITENGELVYIVNPIDIVSSKDEHLNSILKNVNTEEIELTDNPLIIYCKIQEK